MNGSNHLGESDSRPLHFCPMCLRKLHQSVGLDILQRYEQLVDYCRQTGIDDEAEWLSRRLKWIRNE